MMQRVVLAITFPHFFSNLYLYSLLYQQRPNHTSLISYYVRTFQYSQKFVNRDFHFKFFLDRIIRMKSCLSCYHVKINTQRS